MSSNRGAPTKLTPQIIKDVSDLVRGGNYLEVALAMLNIPTSTFYDWMRRGRAERQRIGAGTRTKLRQREAMYVDLSESMERAEAQAEAIRLKVITDCARTDPQWASWFLTHKYPDRWATKVNVSQEVSGPGGGPVEVINTANLTHDEKKQMLELIRKTRRDDTSTTDPNRDPAEP